MEAVDVTGDQKGDFKNLKEKETGGGGVGTTLSGS